MGVSQSLPAGVWVSVDAALPGSLAQGKKKKCARACVRGGCLHSVNCAFILFFWESNTIVSRLYAPSV